MSTTFYNQAGDQFVIGLIADDTPIQCSRCGSVTVNQERPVYVVTNVSLLNEGAHHPSRVVCGSDVVATVAEWPISKRAGLLNLTRLLAPVHP